MALKVNSEVVGQGSRTLIVLHGWGHSIARIRNLAELLGSYGTVHMIDLPGFGSSDPPPTAWGTRDYVKDLKRYIDQNNLCEVDLLGHSFGGRVAFVFAALYPELVRRLVLIDASGLKRRLNPATAFKRQLIVILRAVLKFSDHFFGTSFFSAWFVPRFASADYKNAGAMRPTFVKVANEDQTQAARLVSCKTLLLWGAQDTETPLEVGQRFERLITDSKLIVLPFKGHVPFEDVGAHLCAYYILPFLSEVQNG